MKTTRSTLARVVLSLSLCLAPKASAYLLIDESFSYPDGPLVSVASGVWVSDSGATGQIAVASQKVTLNGHDASEQVSMAIPGGPYTNGDLYMMMTLTFSELPGTNPVCFAQLGDADGNCRARVFVVTNGYYSGAYCSIGSSRSPPGLCRWHSPVRARLGASLDKI